MSGKYIKSYIGEDLAEISIMANKLNNGLNKNEVQLVSKNVKNKGFFEKFFQLFS
jgi:predicted transcriptional regulator